jgi:hypothetical protein
MSRVSRRIALLLALVFSGGAAAASPEVTIEFDSVA